jgi:nucleoside phosphorylase
VADNWTLYTDFKMSPKKLFHNGYTVGWICALPLEMAAAKAMLDEVHTKLPQDSNDHNTYALGAIYGHNVAIACLPSGVYGTASAAIVATHMLFTFRAIRFGLMVGIGGGVPNKDVDIRLGDIAVSKPADTFGGVVQYDYGKAISSGQFQRTGTLNKPPEVLLAAVSNLQADYVMGISIEGERPKLQRRPYLISRESRR